MSRRKLFHAPQDFCCILWNGGIECMHGYLFVFNLADAGRCSVEKTQRMGTVLNEWKGVNMGRES